MKLKTGVALGILACLAASAGAEDKKGPSAQELYDRAQEFQGKKNWVEAEKLYAQVYKQADAPAPIRAAAGLEDGECLLKLNRPASARAALELLLEDYGYQPDIARSARKKLEGIPADAVDAAPSVLDGKSLDLSFKDATVETISGYLAIELNVGVAPDAGEGLAGLKVTIETGDIPAAEAIRQLAAFSKTAIVERAGILIWTTPERAETLAKRPPTEGLKCVDAASEATLKSAREKKLNAPGIDMTCQAFIDDLVRTTGLIIEADALPAGTFVLHLGAEAPVLDVLDVMAFEFGLQLTVKDGKLILKGK